MADDHSRDSSNGKTSDSELGSGTFGDLLGKKGVQKLKARHRNQADIGRSKNRIHSTSLADRRQSAEVSTQSSIQSRTSDGRVEPVSPSQSLLFALHDIDQRIIGRLKRGEIEWQEGLDLHGYTIEEARTQVESFIDDSLARHLRCVLIVHGKAWSAVSGHPVIKSHVNAWLRELPKVLAFCSATPIDGGTGAVYVLLKRHRDD